MVFLLSTVPHMRRGSSAFFSAFTILGLCGVLVGAPMGDSFASTKSKLVFVPHTGQCYVNQDCSALVATARGGTAPYTFESDYSHMAFRPTFLDVGSNGRLTSFADTAGTYSWGACVTDKTRHRACGTIKVSVDPPPTALTNSCTSAPNAPAIAVTAATASSGPTFTITTSAIGDAPTTLYYAYGYFDSTSKTWGAWSSSITQNASLGTSLTYVSPQPAGKSFVAINAYSENACGSSSIVWDNPDQTGTALTAISTPTHSCTSAPNAPTISVTPAAASSGPAFTITASAVGEAPTTLKYAFHYYEPTSNTWGSWSSFVKQNATLGTSLTYVSPQPFGYSRVSINAYSENACGSSSVVWDNPDRTGTVLTAISTSTIVNASLSYQGGAGFFPTLVYISAQIIDANGKTITVPQGKAGLLSFTIADQVTKTVLATWTDLANESQSLVVFMSPTDGTANPGFSLRVGNSPNVAGPTGSFIMPPGHSLQVTVTFAGIPGWSGSSGSIGCDL